MKRVYTVGVLLLFSVIVMLIYYQNKEAWMIHDTESGAAIDRTYSTEKECLDNLDVIGYPGKLYFKCKKL